MYEKIPKGFKNELKRFERQVKNRRRDRESETLRDEKLRDNHMRYIFVVFFRNFFEKSSINEKIMKFRSSIFMLKNSSF